MDKISAHNLGKKYKQYGTNWGRLAEWLTLDRWSWHQPTWVLKGVSFSVGPGESVGIVGQNGAGKSTLLKLLTGTLQPTEGESHIDGRTAALLELGMGFHSDFTGRQNAVMGCQMAGFSGVAIDDLIPGIFEFSELEDYFDQPLRTYSSGMQMRLAFSVATAVRPDVLIIDEALSVGDTYFQHKSMARIREFKELGTTLLFVSHDSGAVKTLCDRAILLEQGVLIKDGPPDTIIDYYNALIADKENSSIKEAVHESGKTQTVSGTNEAQVEAIGLYDEAGTKTELINVGQAVELRIRVVAHAEIPRLVLGYMIKDRLGQEVFGTNTHHTEQPIEKVAAGDRIDYRIRFDSALGPGSYSVSTALVSTDTHLVNNYEWKDLALVFKVANRDKTFFVGSSWIPPVIAVERL